MIGLTGAQPVGSDTAEPTIVVQDISRTFTGDHGDVRALAGLSFQVPAGSFCTLLGPSGCGKSTALRIIAGLERSDTGTVRIAGRTVLDVDAGIEVAANRRQIGMVFQSYAVWPHMSVADNVAYALKVRKVPRESVRERVERALAMVGLDGLGRRSSTQLSGGQQQRVALARALVAEPQVLLLDEPLSNLDAQLRQQLQVELRHLQREIGITTIHVTHDQDEALGMSDELVLLNAGRLVERGTPRRLYSRPRTRFAAGFLGSTNLLVGHRQADYGAGEVTLATALGRLTVELPPDTEPDAEAYLLAVRPEHLSLTRGNSASPRGVQGRINEVLYRGGSIETVIQVGEVTVRARVVTRHEFVPGEQIRVVVDPDDVVVLTDPPA